MSDSFLSFPLLLSIQTEFEVEKKLGTLIFFSHLRALGHVYPKHSSLELSDRTSERTFSYRQILLMHVQKIDKCKILILLLCNSKNL